MELILDKLTKQYHNKIAVDRISLKLQKGVHGLLGANGAGKTNLLKALHFLFSFLGESFTRLKPDDPISFFKPFFKSPDNSYFYLEFRLPNDPLLYHYDLELNSSGVVAESLTKKNKRTVCMLKRKCNDFVLMKDKLKQVKLRSNASMICTINQYDQTLLPPQMCTFFLSYNYHLPGVFGLFSQWEKGGEGVLSIISKFFKTYPKSKKIADEFIHSSDTGISRFDIRETTELSGDVKYFPVFFHKVDGIEYPLLYSEESSGTQALFIILFYFCMTFGFGSILIYDELDISLHPMIVPKLLNLFQDPEKNPKHAQLFFTSHCTDIMKGLRADQIFLLGKENNESYAYCIKECSSAVVRKDRDLIKPYLQGRLGGIPRL